MDINLQSRISSASSLFSYADRLYTHEYFTKASDTFFQGLQIII